jgi:hypothetical protein
MLQNPALFLKLLVLCTEQLKAVVDNAVLVCELTDAKLGETDFGLFFLKLNLHYSGSFIGFDCEELRFCQPGFKVLYDNCPLLE